MLVVVSLLLLWTAGGLQPDGLDRRTVRSGPDIATDTAVVWVFFTDTLLPADTQAPRDWLDLPVPRDYVAQLEATGATLRHVSRWLNAASCVTTRAQRVALIALPCVAEVRAVRRGHRHPGYERTAPLAPSSTAEYPLDYGFALIQLLPLQVPELHALGLSGEGVLMAVLDSGFRLLHESFDSLMASGRLLATWDFVRGDSGVASDTLDPPGQDHHGTEVLSTMVGEAPGRLVGAAPRASFILAKTEDLSQETPLEEDHYVAALEWADSLNAKIISSSLAYDFGYTMDGTQGITTVAANTAASRGLLLVTAMGNSGPMPTTLDAPADAFGIVSVGAVDAAGIIAPFSSRGPTADGRTKPEVVAQGVAVHAADPAFDQGYVAVSGTSFSTPLTAAAAALLLEAHPDWTPLMLREALLQSADRRRAPDNAYGYGRFALLPALDYAPAGALELVPQLHDAFDAADWRLSVVARAAGDRRPAALWAHCERTGGSTDSVPLVALNDSLWETQLPWLGEEELAWRLVAEDAAGRTVKLPPDSHRRLVMRRNPSALVEDFEKGAYRWRRGGTHELFWPQAAVSFEGSFALADSPGGGYPDSCSAWLQSAWPTPVGSDLPWHLTFRTRYQLADSDTAHVEWQAGSSLTDTLWQRAASFSGTESFWQPVDLVLPLVAGDSVWLRFRLETDASTSGDGWYVDSVRLGGRPVHVSESPAKPRAHFLGAFPNPFNAATRFVIRLDQPAEARLNVYDVLGRRVRVLWQGPLPRGESSFAWDALDDRGRRLGSGVYLALLSTGDRIVTRKLMYLK